MLRHFIWHCALIVCLLWSQLLGGFYCTNYNRESRSFQLNQVSRLGKMISSFLIHNSKETDPELFRRVEMKPVPDVFRCPCAESVKYMIISLFRTLHANPRLLQQIVRDKTAHNCILKTRWTQLVTTWSLTEETLLSSDEDKVYLLIKMNFHKLSKPTAVVVPDRLCISKSFKQGVGCMEPTYYKHRFCIICKNQTLLYKTTSSKCLWRTYLQQSSHLYLDLFHKMWLNTWN